MNRDNPSELFPVVDETGRVVGCATRGECHDGRRLLHPVVHLHLFNSRGELYLQKRPLWKDIQPGRWDTAVGGHVDYGEAIADALRREACDEIGLTDISEAKLLKNYLFESEVERELVYCHIIRAPHGFKPTISEPDDIDILQFRPIDDILNNLGNGSLTPNFEREFQSVVYPCLSSNE